MRIIAGVDEVGRGSLIGPVYAAAVILNKDINALNVFFLLFCAIPSLYGLILFLF